MTVLVARSEANAESPYGPHNPSLLAWTAGTLIVYWTMDGASGYTSTWVQAVLAGSLLWGAGLRIPKIWGEAV